jgi:hypothetical protein
LCGTPKNNLGHDDLPSLAFTIESATVDTDDGPSSVARVELAGESEISVDTDDGPSSIGRVELAGESEISVREAMERAHEDPDTRTAIADAVEWLRGYLEQNGGSVNSADAKREGKVLGHSESTLYRARRRLRITSWSVAGMIPRQIRWSFPVPYPVVSPRSGRGANRALRI